MIQFQPLFTIQLIHDYYTKHEKRCTDFDIVPTDECASLMKKMQILYKNHNNKFFTVVNANKTINEEPPPNFKITPFLNFPNDFVLRYYLVLKNPHFLNFTSIALPPSGKCYFSNISKNNTIGNLALSNPFLSFSPERKYSPGNLVTGADDELFEAIRISDDTSESKDLNNASYWHKVTADGSYASGSDEVKLTAGSFHYTLQTPANSITIKIFGLNKTDNELPYDKLLATVVQNYPQNQQSIVINLSKYTPGKYRIVVNTEAETWIYLDPEAVKKNIFGIIEIFHFPKVPAQFKLLGPGNMIKIPEPVYTIWFKSRSVIWKYISQGGVNISVKEESDPPIPHFLESAALNFIPASGLTVQSEKPISLAETPRLLSMTVNFGSGDISFQNLKNPEVENIVVEKEANTGFFVSNMYVKPKKETT